jgi:hypothetical protein
MVAFDAWVSSVIAEIRYYTDYSNPAAPIIRLGAIAEAATDQTLVLAMLGRAQLTADELSRVSGFNRQELEDVWGTLSKAFHDAWEHRPQFDGDQLEVGSMLKYLADRHSMSLHFDPPRRLPLQKSIVELVERQPKSLGKEILQLLELRLGGSRKRRKATPSRKKTPSPVVRATPARVSFRESTFTEGVARI